MEAGYAQLEGVLSQNAYEHSPPPRTKNATRRWIRGDGPVSTVLTDGDRWFEVSSGELLFGGAPRGPQQQWRRRESNPREGIAKRQRVRAVGDHTRETFEKL